VARETLRIVIGNIPHHLLVRIVAGNATDARIGSIETSAVGQPVRLEADIRRPFPMGAHHSFPTPMALTTEVR
jgi:hypothetical protein